MTYIFRCYDKEYKTWLFKELPIYSDVFMDYLEKMMIAIDDYVLQMWTGAVDKNGAKIFDGDRIVVTDSSGNQDSGYLAYNEKEMAFVIDWGDDRYMRMADCDDEIEVVGKLYE